MGNNLNIVMLCGPGQSSRIMYNALASSGSIKCVVVESKPSKALVIRQRVKKIGVLRVVGQLLFLLANKLLASLSKSRVAELINEYGLNDDYFPERVVRRVDSANDLETIKILKQMNPDVVVVNGTRILSKAVLSSVAAPFINTHMGITPKYRGVHGGYWALTQQDAQNCGVTVHLVDEGIDTGGVLYQSIVRTGQGDGFNTYPIHQIANAIPLMKQALADIKNKHLKVAEGVGPSCLWSHPTLFEYIKYRFAYGVK